MADSRKTQYRVSCRWRPDRIRQTIVYSEDEAYRFADAQMTGEGNVTWIDTRPTPEPWVRLSGLADGAADG